MALTQSQLVNAVADRAEMSKAEAKRALTALEDVVLEQIGDAQKIRIGLHDPLGWRIVSFGHGSRHWPLNTSLFGGQKIGPQEPLPWSMPGGQTGSGSNGSGRGGGDFSPVA